MLSGTEFDKHHMNTSATCEYVVVLAGTSAYNLYCFSREDMRFGSVQSYGLLEKTPTIKEKVDPLTKRWSISSVTISLSNRLHIRDGANMVALSELEWSGTSTAVITDASRCSIYAVAGNTSSTITTDGICVFDGYIVEPPSYDKETVTIKATPRCNTIHRELPTARIDSVYTDAPDEFKDKRIPLAYGDFTFDIDDPYGGTGMAKGFPTERKRNPKMVFSDHVLNAITDLWLEPIASPFPLEYPSHTLTSSDSGRGTGSGSTSAYVKAYFIPNGHDRHDYNFNTRPDPLNIENAYDTSATTYATGLDYFDDGSSRNGDVAFSFSEEDENAITSIFKHGDDLGESMQLYVRHKSQNFSGRTNYSSGMWLYYGVDGATDYAISGVEDVMGAGLYLDGTYHVCPIDTYGATYAFPDDQNERFCLLVEMEENDEGDGSTGDTYLIKVYDLKLYIRYYFPEKEGYSYQVTPNKGNPDDQIAYAVCKGREFGLWITDGGRSVDGRSSGDLIEDPAFIIESILRNELSFTDIDTDSFDDAADAGVTARLNLHSDNLMQSDDVIKQLAEQSTFAFTFTADGKARLIPLDSTSWSSMTADRTIHAEHIVDKDVTVSYSAAVANDIDVDSRWQQEYGIYRDSDNFADSTSKGYGHGTLYDTYRWPNICGASVTTVAEHLVKTSTGILSNRHLTIELETVAFTNTDLELGDCIALDNSSLSPHVTPPGGGSWSGKKFVVVELRKGDTTRIKAMQLHE